MISTKLQDMRTEYELRVEHVTRNLLESMQDTISAMVGMRDYDRLTALQACIGTLFRQAAECGERGVDYEIDQTDPQGGTA